MARPITNDTQRAIMAAFGHRFDDRSEAILARRSDERVRSSFASTSIRTSSGAPRGASCSSDVGVLSAPASRLHDQHVRKLGMGALGRRIPAR